MTLFSASKYGGVLQNRGAVAVVRASQASELDAAPAAPQHVGARVHRAGAERGGLGPDCGHPGLRAAGAALRGERAAGAPPGRGAACFGAHLLRAPEALVSFPGAGRGRRLGAQRLGVPSALRGLRGPGLAHHPRARCPGAGGRGTLQRIPGRTQSQVVPPGSRSAGHRGSGLRTG
ncbi:unnamed protein product, partial [Effrenium voratum]